MKQEVTKIVIKPDQTLIFENDSDVETLRQMIMDLLLVKAGDIQFERIDKDLFVCPICAKVGQYSQKENPVQRFKQCQCGYVFDYQKKY